MDYPELLSIVHSPTPGENLIRTRDWRQSTVQRGYVQAHRFCPYLNPKLEVWSLRYHFVHSEQQLSTSDLQEV